MRVRRFLPKPVSLSLLVLTVGLLANEGIHFLRSAYHVSGSITPADISRRCVPRHGHPDEMLCTTAGYGPTPYRCSPSGCYFIDFSGPQLSLAEFEAQRQRYERMFGHKEDKK